MNILAFTGSRADYYLQRPLFIAIQQNPSLNLSLIVSCGIIAEIDRSTLDSIHGEGFHICAELSLPSESIDHLSTISHLLNRLPVIISDCNPDLCIVYADRYESFAFALSCFHSNRILLHVESGDLTYGGTYDDSLRHAISHISHLYSTSTLASCDVLLSFGISSWRIHHSGLLSYDNLASMQLPPPVDVLANLNLDICSPLVLATMHPIPRDKGLTRDETNEFFKALKQISKIASVIITAPNHDSGREVIVQGVQHLIDSPNVRYVESLGAANYYSLMSYSTIAPVIVAGNSSSIIKEAPFFNAHSLNVGCRQAGRVKSSTQVDVPAESKVIYKEIRRLIEIPCLESDNPYHKPGSVDDLVEFIDSIMKDKSRDVILANNIFSEL